MTGLLGSVDQLRNLLLALAELLLQMAKQFLFLAIGVGQVVISEIGELLPELPFQFMPFTFELEFVHDQVRKGVRSMPEQMERPDCCQSKSVRLSRHSSSHFTMGLKLVLDCCRCAPYLRQNNGQRCSWFNCAALIP